VPPASRGIRTSQARTYPVGVAARRLVIVMLVLLAISTLIAALLPPPHNEDPATPPPGAKRGPHKRGPEHVPSPGKLGLLLVARMRISHQPPKTVRVERGDELRLTVAAPFGDDIEIPALGRTAPVTPASPASFDLLATGIGAFDVRAVHSGRLAGRLLSGRPGTGRCGVSTPATPQGRASTRSCSPRGRHGSGDPGRSAPRPSGAGGRQRR
jgi:hypothetical protein